MTPSTLGICPADTLWDNPRSASALATTESDSITRSREEKPSQRAHVSPSSFYTSTNHLMNRGLGSTREAHGPTAVSLKFRMIVPSSRSSSIIPSGSPTVAWAAIRVQLPQIEQDHTARRALCCQKPSCRSNENPIGSPKTIFALLGAECTMCLRLIRGSYHIQKANLDLRAYYRRTKTAMLLPQGTITRTDMVESYNWSLEHDMSI
jgi:hypothetical protein